MLLIAQPNEQAPQFHARISPTLLPTRRREFPHSLHADRWLILQPAVVVVGGGQRSGRFSGGNARKRTSFGRRPVAFSW